MYKVIAIPEASSVIGGGGIKVFIHGLLGLVINLSKNLLFGNTLHYRQINLPILHINLILGYIRREYPILHDLIQLDFILDQGVGGYWDFNILRRDYHRSLCVFIGRDGDQISAVGAEIQCRGVDLDKIYSSLLVSKFSQIFI